MTELQARRAIRRLSDVFQPPAGDPEQRMRTWRYVLDDVSESELEAAVGEYLRSEARYWPKPGQIRALALNQRTTGTSGEEPPSDWNQLQEGPCPVCGAVLQLLTAEQTGMGTDVFEPRTGGLRKRKPEDPPATVKRYGVLHDGHAHRRAGKVAVGYVTYSSSRSTEPRGAA